MAQNPSIRKCLQLSKDCDDEAVSSNLVALLTSAIHDANPRKELIELKDIIFTEGGSSYIDPLNMLPILLPYNVPDGREIISLIGECGSAKEVVIAVQEAMERLEDAYKVDPEEETFNAHSSSEDNFESAPKVAQLVILIDLYAAAIPRLKLRRKSASDTIKPLLRDLDKVLSFAGPEMSRHEARVIVSNVSKLAQNVCKWIESVTTDSQDEEKSSKEILKDLLDCVTRSCVPNVQASISQRTFEECFPRLTFRSTLGTEWKDGDIAVSELLDTYTSLDVELHTLKGPVVPIQLIASAYRPSSSAPLTELLQFLLPSIISSLQSNIYLDESLAVLLRSLSTLKSHSKPSPSSLPDEISVPLLHLLSTIASAHSDPQTRHQSFRILSMLLALSDPLLRFQHLAELTGNSEFPSMRVAAVGLVKESLLHALARADSGVLTGKDDIMIGPMFLRTFGPILLQPNPHDLFQGDDLELELFEDSPEPVRLVECLSLYYVLLQRDVKNLTGIRDKDVLKTVENNLLTPLRTSLDRWTDDTASENGLHNISSVVALKISLERIAAAKANL